MTDPQDIPSESIWHQKTLAPTVLSSGDTLGRFTIVDMVGRGGMGEVWKAFDPHRQTHVVIKLLPLLQLGNEVELHRIRESFRKVSKLQHQHICPVYDLDIDKRVGHYLVMKFIPGETLAMYRYRLSKSNGEVTAKQAVEVLRPVAMALDYAHKEKVVHRDVKPQNIMVQNDGSEAQLVDFGLADEIRVSATRVSRVQFDISGTYPYMSPEQWRGRQQDGRTDQYALAVVVYEFIAGHPPFESVDAQILRECVLHDEPASLPCMSNSANAVLRQALAKESTDRFASCTEFLDHLESALSHETVASNTENDSAEPGGVYSDISSQPTAVGIAKPPAPPSVATSRVASSRSKETWYTAALVFAIAGAGWLLRDDLIAPQAAQSSAAPLLSPAANTVSSSAQANANPVQANGAVAVTPASTGAASTPPVAPAPSQVPGSSPGPSQVPVSSPVSPPVSSTKATPVSTPPAAPAQAVMDAALVKQVQQSQDLANKAKRDAASHRADQYASSEWNRANILLSDANQSFAQADLSSAIEQYQSSARTFYSAIDQARKAYAISQNFRELLRELASLRGEAEAVGAERLAAVHYSSGVAADAEMKRLYDVKDYIAASGKLDEATSSFRTAIAQSRAMEKIELARKTYDRQVDGIDPRLLNQHGGQGWLDAVNNIKLAEAERDIEKLEASYATALTLLPSIHTKIREQEISGLSTNGNHAQVLDILWPNWDSLDPVMKKTFVSSASVSPQWWLDQASKQADSATTDAHGKAMLYLSISDVYRRQGNLASAKSFITKAMNSSLNVDLPREAMETSLEIAQEIDGKADPKSLAALITQANVDLDSINAVGMEYRESQEIPWVKYYFPLRFAALFWRIGNRQEADRYNQLAFSSSVSSTSFYTDLLAFQAMLIFAESGDTSSLHRMQNVEKGRILLGNMTGNRPYRSLLDAQLFQLGSNRSVQNGQDSFELLVQTEIALTASRVGDDDRYRVHSRNAEAMVKAFDKDQGFRWTSSMVNARLAMGEAYRGEFVAGAGRLRNYVKHRFALGEAALTLGRQQLRSKEDVLNNGIEGAKNTLREFANHPRMSLLAKDIASSAGKEDLGSTIDWMNSLTSDHLRLAAMAGLAEATKP